MSLLLGILLAIFVFLIVVLVHEFGHFFTARLSRMRVLEFGFGIPPKLCRIWTDKLGTDYTYNWLPIGGFVRILGEDPSSEDAKKEGAFMTRPWIQRVIVLIAGVTMNFLLAILIFTGLFLDGAKPIAVNTLASGPTGSFFLPSLEEARASGYITYDGVLISSLSGSIAESVGIGEGERVVSANDIPIHNPMDLIEIVKTADTLSLVLQQDVSSRTVDVTPQDGRIGVAVGYANLTIDRDYTQQYSIGEALMAGVRETYMSSVMTLSFLSHMLQGIVAPDTPQEREDAKNMLSGPIGVGATFVGLVEMSAPVSIMLVVIALISVNLGVFNLLPIPALDGGRIVTTTIYSLVMRYSHGSLERFLVFERYFHAIGFFLLILLTLYVAGIDILRFF